MRNIRQKIQENAEQGTAEKIAAHILLLPEIRKIEVASGGVIAGYIPINGEMDILPTLQAFFVAHHPIALPVIKAKGQPLSFREWDFKAPLNDAEYGTKEPSEEAAEQIVDVMLVPLLGFDETGMRLGYGGGFYDRTIEEYRSQGRKLITIGVAFEGQKQDHIPTSDHDQKLDIIVTEQQIYRS